MKGIQLGMGLVLVFALGLVLTQPVPVSAQLGPCAVPLGPKLPDLIVNKEKLRGWHIERTEFSPDSCTIAEECTTGIGVRKLLLFTSNTPNIGEADLFIGDPTKCVGTLFQFEFSQCHGHLHFKQYADYRLWTPAGYQTWMQNRDTNVPTSDPKNVEVLERLKQTGDLVAGRKQGFCIVDLIPYVRGVSGRSPVPQYTSCGTNQGISVGWADEYTFLLGCQFIDITDVPPGRYVLEDEVNPERLFPESDYSNNAAAVEVVIP